MRLAAVAALALSVSTAALCAPVTGTERAALVPGIAAALRDGYVFPEKVPAIVAALKQRERTGAYAASDGEALARTLTEDLRRIGGDVHLGVDYDAAGIDDRPVAAPSPERRAAMEQRARAGNYGIDKVEMLAGGIGTLRITAFLKPAEANAVLEGAMRFLANSKALVIDLRGNHGGSPAMVAQVASYLLPEGTHLNDIYMREGNVTRQFWSSAVRPELRYDRPVYVLIDHETVSAGEELAYDLQTQKRATLVGEVTKGGANPGGPVKIADHFQLFVPGGRAINPVTHTNWEGVGVTPDIAVTGPQALDRAVALASAG